MWEHFHLFAHNGVAHPCTHIAAAWVICLLGRTPSDPESPASWRACAPEVWDAINITDHSRLWSGPEMVESLASATTLAGFRDGEPPRLAVGVWYFVQRWTPDRRVEMVNGRPKLTRGRGHSTLVRPEGLGLFRVIQSSEDEGYRDEVLEEWVPEGFDVAAVPLEAP